MTLTGSDLVHATYRPIFGQLADVPTTSLPIIPSSHVTQDSGTGLVHCAPAHGAEDYAVMQSLGLLSTSPSGSSNSNSSISSGALVCHVNGLGQFSYDVADVVGSEAARRLVDKDVLDQGGREIVGLLTEVGALRKIQRFKHRYPYDWKTDKPVIVLCAANLFLRLPYYHVADHVCIGQHLNGSQTSTTSRKMPLPLCRMSHLFLQSVGY